MRDKNKVIVGVSCGDINGIGLEVLINSFTTEKLFDRCVPVLYVPVKTMKSYLRALKIKDFDLHIIKNPKDALMYKMNIIDFAAKDNQLSLGKSTKFAAQIAVDSLSLGVSDLKKNLTDLLLTLPVNKHNISLAKKDFVGHTEFLSKQFDNQKNLMILCGQDLKIATVTNHVAISNISGLISKSIIDEKISILYQTLRMDFLISKPKIAVLSLNPHSGDNGLIGYEDDQIIKPVIVSWFNSGHEVYGPYSADAFFGSKKYKNFDAVLGMYHDQSLIPFKTICFGEGVNYTAGLSAIRVSPDHGVAYDIAGKGLANSQSLVYSLLFSLELFNNRSLYLKNLLKTKVKQ